MFMAHWFGVKELRLWLQGETGGGTQLCYWLNKPLLCPTETDDKMRAFAEQVFASETKGEDVRDEISMFDVDDDCPIMHQEMAHHLHTEDDAEKRWGASLRGRFC